MGYIWSKLGYFIKYHQHYRHLFPVFIRRSVRPVNFEQLYNFLYNIVSNFFCKAIKINVNNKFTTYIIRRLYWNQLFAISWVTLERDCRTMWPINSCFRHWDAWRHLYLRRLRLISLTWLVNTLGFLVTSNWYPCALNSLSQQLSCTLITSSL